VFNGVVCPEDANLTIARRPALVEISDDPSIVQIDRLVTGSCREILGASVWSTDAAKTGFECVGESSPHASNSDSTSLVLRHEISTNVPPSNPTALRWTPRDGFRALRWTPRDGLRVGDSRFSLASLPQSPIRRLSAVRQTIWLQTSIVRQTERPFGRLLFENDLANGQRLIRPLMRVLTSASLDGGADRRSGPQPDSGRRRRESDGSRRLAAEIVAWQGTTLARLSPARAKARRHAGCSKLAD
jgi:hypothetical protein